MENITAVPVAYTKLTLICPQHNYFSSKFNVTFKQLGKNVDKIKKRLDISLNVLF